jgi:hypothetical protein
MTKLLPSVVVLLALGGLAAAQEQEVPKDSERISVPGCARGRTFIVGEREEHEPVRSNIAPSRRLRLSGPKKILDEIKLRERTMIEVTGLIRKSQVEEQGVSVAGGRIRIGGGQPQAGINDPRRDPRYNEVVIDVEAWRQLAGDCPAR